MQTIISAGSPILLSIPEVAWLLGVDQPHVCRLIRVGMLPVVRRRSRVLVPTHVLAHLADDTSEGVSP
ncbi:MAG TPA: helix-turn-helix domain-containing protein [Actinophytocola sp.]|uniref:helix-turn-helix domain-containing protein n=1 Tax=Actinophytocola sp. TaxID=1872138 RepID=UPI002DDCADAE|nr:helix-turn-helix domain-containing protein [Actinophytocola sp.]HEV2780209.1 helix-turn-helix domain-containing protein [Actinophytocola sp.]